MTGPGPRVVAIDARGYFTGGGAGRYTRNLVRDLVCADDRVLAPHLFVARHACRLMGAGFFTTMDLGAVDALELIPELAATTAPRARTVQ